MKKMKKCLMLFVLFLILTPSTQADQTEIKFLFPLKNGIWVGKKQIKINVTGIDLASVRSLQLFLDGKLLREFKDPPYTLLYDFGPRPRFRKLKAVLRDVHQNIISKEIRSEFFDDTQEVNIVQIVVPVAVIDQKGNYVTGLKKNDFILLEDGIPQDIDYFTKSSRTKFNLALLIDISSSMKNKIGKVKEAARLFLEELLTKDDRAIIVFFNHDVFEDTDFTNDIDELFNSLSVAFPFGATALYDAVAYCIKLLKSITGRNIIILFSDGEDNSSYIDPYTLIKNAEKSNSVIYSIGKKLDTYEDSRYQDLLNKISTSSGGMTFFFEKVEDIEYVYRKIRQDIRAKYIIQFSPKDDKVRKRFRKISIKLKNRRKYKIRTIKGYYY
ncbi:MAG: VWA domain-containing protein [Candidatus Aminicenantes bacterium]|nr:VWA domain-containing protein [Candidatus Aminicenantes bacterium]